MNHQKDTRLQLFNNLRGVWKLERHLGEQGHMQGTARFQIHGPNLLFYQEKGNITLKRHKVIPASCTYAYVYNRGNIAIHFWDWKRKEPAGLLHTLQFHRPPTTHLMLMATGTYACINDVYKAHYTFISYKFFQLIYQVQGPSKDYTIQTHFIKVPNRVTSL